MSDFDKLVRRINEVGQRYVEAKLQADQLDEDARPYLSSLQNALDDGEKSEAKIKRLAEGSKEYRDYVTRMCLARSKALSLRVEYEALQSLFDARRSEGALERAKLERGIHGIGG